MAPQGPDLGVEWRVDDRIKGAGRREGESMRVVSAEM